MATQSEAMQLSHGGPPLTAAQVRSRVNLIQEVMAAVMKKATHYGIIPGCEKPSLWKPGAEVLFATFQISVDPAIEDLSTRDEARFRVVARATSAHGTPLGSAVGEASSDEEKYKWRTMVCQEEWDATPEDRRRMKWKKGQSKPYPVLQIRTEIADCRNTIVKMASKRAYVALALQVTAASDIFTQDIEDLPEELQHTAEEVDAPEALPTEIKRKESSAAAAPAGGSSPRGEDMPHPPPATRPAERAASPPPAPRPVIQSPKPPAVRVISEGQARRFYAIWKGANRTGDEVKQYLREEHGIDDDRQITAARYEEACKWAEGF